MIGTETETSPFTETNSDAFTVPQTEEVVGGEAGEGMIEDYFGSCVMPSDGCPLCADDTCIDVN